MPLPPVQGQRVDSLDLDILREHTLDYYDGPRMVLLEARAGTRYLALWNDESDSWARWLLIETGNDRLNRLLRGDISLLDAILHPETGFIVVCDQDPTGRKFPIITTADSIPQESLPSAGTTINATLPPGWQQ